MNKTKSVTKSVWDKVYTLLLTLFVLFPNSPLNMPHPYRDSGVFLYIGWRISAGQVPYKDIWDHKPPVIYFINALGLMKPLPSTWGVWLIEVVFLSIAAYTGFWVLKQLFGIATAVITTLLWMMTLLFVLSGGNLTTEYALAMQFLALALVYKNFNSPLSNMRWFLFGMLGALAFFTKQNAIGIWIATLFYVTHIRLKKRQSKALLTEVLFTLGGAITILLIVVGYFQYNRALSDFWNAAFVYNFSYISVISTPLDRMKPILLGIDPLTRTGLFQLGMIGYLFIILFINKNQWKSQSPILFIILIDLPIEFLLVSFSGRFYPHYYMSLLPGFAIMAGFIFWKIFLALPPWRIGNKSYIASLIGMMFIILWATFPGYVKLISTYRYNNRNAVVKYLKTTTSTGDTVLLWGAEASINFAAQKRSPTRFVYQYPLYMKPYTNEKMILEFLDDILVSQPKLIINTKNPNTPFFDFPIKTDSIAVRIDEIQRLYRNVGTIESWTVYEYIDE